MKKSFLTLTMFGFLFIFSTTVNANTSIELKTDNFKINNAEIFDVTLYAKEEGISAGDFNIFFDTDKLEYISGPDNANFYNGRIIYSWFSEEGKEKKEFEMDKFQFKAKKDGISKIVINGTCYNENGEIVKTDFNNLDIQIGETISTLQQTEEENGTNTDKNSSYLKIMRTNIEGIVPNFDPYIFEYYITTIEDIDRIDLTAIAENKNAKVEITGNENLKKGVNKVVINVTSENGEKTSSYIIYVTKTDNLEKSNTNLENLAVEYFDLFPEFQSNITEYRVEIDNNVENINILAIPENINAKINITGNGKLDIGDNNINVNVKAEDGISYKNYKIVVHRRNTDEQLEFEKQEKINIERLSTILEGSESNENNTSMEENIYEEEAEEEDLEIEENRIRILCIVIIIIIVTIIIIIYLKKKRSKSK